MQKRRRVSVRRVVAVCGLCIWGLAACGGGDGSTTGATPCMGAFCSSSSDSGFVGNSNGSASGVNGSGDAQCDELTSSTDACDACLGASCCSEMAACEADVQCQRFYECAYACEDESCTADCQATYPDGFDVFYAFYECYDASCVTDCAAGDGSSSDGTSATGGAVDAQCSEIKNSADACDACIGSSCCEQLVACDEDAECSGYASCTGACSDEACFADCEGAYPDG